MRRRYDRPEAEAEVGDTVPFFVYCPVRCELDVHVLVITSMDENWISFRQEDGSEVSLAGLHEDRWGAFDPKTIRLKVLAHARKKAENIRETLEEQEQRVRNLVRDFRTLEDKEW